MTTSFETRTFKTAIKAHGYRQISIIGTLFRCRIKSFYYNTTILSSIFMELLSFSVFRYHFVKNFTLREYKQTVEYP